MKFRSSRFVWIFFGFVLVVGLLQSVAALQPYLARGGRHPWEPFLWELSSVALAALLRQALAAQQQTTHSLEAELGLIAPYLATNPAVCDAFALAMVADGEAPAYPGLARA